MLQTPIDAPHLTLATNYLLATGSGITVSKPHPLAKSNLIEIVNGDKKYTSQKRADYYVKSGRADYDEKHRLVFREIGRFITQQKNQNEVRMLGNSSGQEWMGTPSGKGGPNVMQLAYLRDRGIRAIQRKLGMDEKNDA